MILFADKRLLQRFSYYNLFAFAFSVWFSTALANLCLLLMAISWVCQSLETWPKTRDNLLPGRINEVLASPWILSLFFAGYALLTGLASVVFLDQPLAKQFCAVWKWSALWLFFLPAWWMDKTRVDGRALCYAAFLGFCLRCILSLFWQHNLHNLDLFLLEQRSGLFIPANSLAMYALILILGVLVLEMPVLWESKAWLKRLLLLARCLALFLGLELLLVSQSRTGILALVIVFPVVLAGYFCKRGRKKIPLLVIFVGLAILLTCLQSDNLKDRFVKEGQTLRELSTLSWQDIPYDSIGFRYHMFRFGLQKWQERKWFGYGPGTVVTKVFASRSGLKELATRNDLHNGWLVVMVRLGLFGLFFFFWGGVLLLKRLFAWRKKSSDMFWFLTGAFAILFVCSMTNFRWIHTDFRFVWLLLAALAWQGPIRQEGCT